MPCVKYDKKQTQKKENTEVLIDIEIFHRNSIQFDDCLIDRVIPFN